MKFQYAETTLKEVREIAATETEDKELLDFALQTAELPENNQVLITIHAGGRVDYAVFEEKPLRHFDASDDAN